MAFEKIADALPMLNPVALKPSLNPVLVVDGKGLEEVSKFLYNSGTIQFVEDYEYNVTEGFYRRRARTLQLGNKDVQYIIDFLAFADGDTRKLIHGQGGFRKSSSPLHRQGGLLRMYTEDETSFEEAPVNLSTFRPIVDVLEPAMNSDSHLKIAHYADAEYVTALWCLGIRSWNFYDTFLVERLLHNGKIPAHQSDFYGLADLVARYFKLQLDKTAQTTFDLHSPLTTDQVTYCALDIRCPWQLKALQEPEVEKARLVWTAKIENDAMPAFGDMHINGLYVHPPAWQQIIDDNERDLEKAYTDSDQHFVPLVGEKELPDPERVAVAHAAFKLCDVPTSEENEVTAAIKAAKKAKDTAEVDLLTQKRGRLQEERAQRKAEAKAAHKAVAYLATKGHADEVAKMKGRAKLNFNSADQVKAALYKGPWGFSEKTLPDLNAKTTLLEFMKVPIIAAYVKIKKIEKQLGTYGYRWITPRNQIAVNSNDSGFVDPDTGRIHPPFSQLGTDTGRPSCRNPNVLNLPKEARFRAAFLAREGYMNITKDCSGQELRILVQISREVVWIEAFLKEEDLHSISTHMVRPKQWEAGTVHVPTEMLVENKKGEKVMTLVPACAYFHSLDGLRRKCKCPEHDKMRTKFKAVNFGIAYDKQAYSLSIELGIPEEEAQAILDGWKATFRTTDLTLIDLRETAYQRGEARSLSGRRRILTRVTMEQARRRANDKYGEKDHSKYTLNRVAESLIAAVKREGGNMPIQGTGADMMKLAMGCGFDPDGKPFLWHILGNALLENYVYDEFMVETPEEYCDIVGGPGGVGGMISDAIIRAGAQFITVVPMASEGAIAKSWTK